MAYRYIFTAGAMLVALQVSAAEASDLSGCKEISEPSARLACYDSLAGGVVEESHDTRIQRQTRQFGLSEQQKAPEERKEVERISAKILSAGGRRVTLDNGMVWKVTDGEDLLGWVREGQMATIRKGLFSGYRMTVDGVTGKAVVDRVQ